MADLLAAANAGKGVPPPGLEALADTGDVKNPYVSQRSGFNTAITKLADGSIRIETAFRSDWRLGYAAVTDEGRLGMPFERLLAAFTKSGGRAAKLRTVGGGLFLFVGPYAGRRFGALEASVELQRLGPAESLLAERRIGDIFVRQRKLDALMEHLSGLGLGPAASSDSN